MRLLHPEEYKDMTHDEIDKCQPGKSLDMLVAAACDLKFEFSTHDSLFRPSTDWNDAMVAADRAFGVRPFRVVREVSHDPNNGFLPFWFGWSVEIKDDNTHEDEWSCPSSVCDETGPLAICRAILKSKVKP